MAFFYLLDTLVSITGSYLEYFTNITLIVGSIWGLRKWNLGRKFEKIKNDLTKQKDLKNVLDEYVLMEDKNNIKDIAIRLIYYEHYPYNLNNDGYKYCLQISYDKGIFLGSWRDNTGIKICEHIWFSGCSIYVNHINGISFIDYAGKIYKNFQEYKKPRLVSYLLYRNIIDYDFEHLLEHEPRFYVRYKGLKNFDKEARVLPNSEDDDYMVSIDSRLIMKKYNLLLYLCYIMKSKILKIPPLQMKTHI